MKPPPPEIGPCVPPARGWARIRNLEGRLEFLQRPGPWLWVLLAMGAFLRSALVLRSRGTADVLIWSDHAAGVAQQGLIRHYENDRLFNHPPAVSLSMAWLWNLAQWSGIPFRILYRAPIALADFCSGFLVALVLGGRPQRWLALGAYAIAPIAVVLSAHHGNTDPLIASCLLACTLLAATGHPLLCGVVLGAGFWVKVPVILGAPAIGFALPRWRDRVLFGCVALGVGISTYLPALAQEPALVGQRIFGYHGLSMQTTAGIPVWGARNFLSATYGHTVEAWPGWARVYILHDRQIALASIVMFAWLRRRANDARGLAATLAGSFALFYGLINSLSFQYLAWSMPFWLLAGLPFALCANLFAGGFIYLLYAYVCGDWLLRTKWDFNGHPDWPGYLLRLRDLSVITFLVFGLGWLARAMFSELAYVRGRWRKAGGRIAEDRAG